MNEFKQPQFPNPFVVKAIAIALCGIVAVSVAHPGVSACVQATVIEVVSVSNLRRVGEKLKEIQRRYFRGFRGKKPPKKPDNKKK